MLIDQIEKHKKIPKAKRKTIRDLVALASDYDQMIHPFDWETMSHRQSEHYVDFLFYHQRKLIGTISLYDFEETTYEVSAVVHPKYRRQGIFTEMMAEVLPHIRQQQKQSLVFLIAENAKPAHICLNKLAAQYQYSEYVLEKSCNQYTGYTADLLVLPAKNKDLDFIVSLDAKGQDLDKNSLKERYKSALKSRKREILMVMNNQKKIVGKIHLKWHHDYVWLHNEHVILQDKKLQNNTADFFNAIIGFLSQKTDHPMRINVQSYEKDNLSLYQELGLSPIQRTDYWIMPLNKPSKSPIDILH